MKIQFIMPKIFNHITCKIVTGVILVSVIAACNQKPQTIKSEQETIKIDTVKVFVLRLDSAQKIISFPGELKPNENALIRAKVQGYIRKLNVDIGSKVRKGQILALIDAPEINSRVQELNSKVKASYSRYLSSKDYYDRLSNASKTDGVIAESELQHFKDQMLAEQSEYNAALFSASSVKQIGNYLAIVAPYSGTITKRNIDEGSFVGNPNEQPLFELEDNSVLRLQVAIPEVYTGSVLLGNTEDLVTPAFPDKKFKAKLVRKSGSIDIATRSEIWEFEVPNANRELKAGSYADVKLHFIRPKPTFVVPGSAVVSTLEKKFVIKVTNETAQWVDVRAGFNMGDKQEIFADLNVGDTLVSKANAELKEGEKVISIIQK